MHSFWEDTNPWCLALPPASHSSEVPDTHSSGAEWSSSGSSPLTHQLRPGLSSGSHVLEHSPPVRKDNYKSKLCTCVCECACTLSHLNRIRSPSSTGHTLTFNSFCPTISCKPSRSFNDFESSLDTESCACVCCALAPWPLDVFLCCLRSWILL